MRGWLMILSKMAWRHLTERKLRTALTVAGIAAGVALMLSIAVINATLLSSFRSSVKQVAGRAELEVAAPDATGLPANVVDRIAVVEGVQRAVPVLRSVARVRGSEGAVRVLFLGITREFSSLFPDDPELASSIRLRGGFGLGEGAIFTVILAESIDSGLGDSVIVATPHGPRPVEITGLLDGGPLALLNSGELSVMLLSAAQELFDKAGRVDSVFVEVAADADLNAVEAELRSELADNVIVGPPGTRAGGLERVFGSLNTLLSLVGTVALFVSLFVVYNTMSMTVAERRREISMALSFGAGRKHFFGALLTEAALLGVIAAALGVAGGLLLARVLVERAAEGYRIFSVAGAGSVVLRPAALFLAGAAGVVVSLVGAYLPAHSVLRLAPIESLRPAAGHEWRQQTRRPLLGTSLALGLLALALGLGVAYVVNTERRWLVTVSVLSGLGSVTLLLPRIVPIAVAIVRPILVGAAGIPGRLAAGSLQRNPGRTTGTVAAFVLTFGMVIGVGSAIGSYQAQIEATAGALIGAPIYIASDSYSGVTSDQPLPLSLQRDLEAVEGVRFVYPLRFLLLSLKEEQALIYVVPVEAALEQGATSDLSAITPDPEAFLAGLAKGGIAVSQFAAERHGLDVGDELELPTTSGARSFEVGAIFDDLVSFDSIYMDDATYRSVWRDRHADEFGVLLDPGQSASVVEDRLRNVIEAAGLEADVLPRRALLGRIMEIVSGTFELGRGIQLAALVIALLTVANTMFTAVLERRWEMGLQRAVGMSRSQIGREVVVEAVGIGLIGGAGGVVVGVASGWLMTRALEVEYAWRIAYQVPVELVAAAVLGGAVLAAAAGVVPSRLAVGPPIVEALRYE